MPARRVRAGVGPRPVQRARSGGDDQYRQRIARMRFARTATGASDFALVDINELIRFRDKQGAPRSRPYSCCSTNRPMPSSPAKAVASTRSPISRAKRSASPRAIFRSGCGRLWRGRTASRHNRQSRTGSAPRCASRSCRRDRSTRWPGSPTCRRSNLRDRGVPADDLRCCAYADYGCEAYGFAVIVNPALAATRPEAVKVSCAR